MGQATHPWDARYAERFSEGGQQPTSSVQRRPARGPPVSAALPRRILSVLAIAALLVTVLASLPAEATGRTFYVAPGGDDDGRGTENDPWGTIYYGMEQL